MKAPSDIVATARLPPHGPLCHGSLMGFSSLSMTLMSTMRGLRPQEPLSCLNRRMGRQRDDIELRIWKDIAGCSWHETSRPRFTFATALPLCRSLAMRARIEARSFTPLYLPPNKQLQRAVTRNRGRTAQRAAAELRR